MNILRHRIANPIRSLFFLGLFLLTGLSAGAQVTLAGTITNEAGAGISNVPVFLTGDLGLITFTATDGSYQFEVPAAGSYTVLPYADSDHVNGLSVLDIVLLMQHAEGTQLLDSPYKIIAADINNSGFVTFGDTLGIFNLVLGIENGFPSNTSWRFIDADYVFPNPQNPWLQAFPEAVNLNNVLTDMTGIDFIGIKVGDLNVTAIPHIFLDPCDISCGLIRGDVFYDQNGNCLKDAGEDGLQTWLVTAASETDTFVTSSNYQGVYSIPVFPGDYTLTVTPPNGLWTACQTVQNVTVGESEVVVADFSGEAIIECPALEVDLGSGPLRPCFNGSYSIGYCNQGTAVAENVVVEATFDPLLTINASNPPWTIQNGNSFTWELGGVEVNACGTIFLNISISCDAGIGQTLCSYASISPDTICPPPSAWDGSRLEVSAFCDGDSVRFEIINEGAPMVESVEYIVIEDDMIMMTGDDPVMLASQEIREVAIPANGSTWRLEVYQTPDYPLGDRISAALEGCGENGSGSFSLGFINQFPWYTSGPTRDVDCVETTASFDPNDKQATPKGALEEHFIERNVDLEYKIRFQNTGTDTAFNVFIRDTLSSWLDASSVRPGASSHDYQFKWLDEHVIEFRFPDIMLPDSNVNEPLSNGFVQFQISQLPDNPLGTVIENQAAIYFDFNEAVITNTVFHTVGENFLEVINQVVSRQGDQPAMLKTFPVPMNDRSSLVWEGQPLEAGKFLLFDLQGRLVREESFVGHTLVFFRDGLKSGLYVFEVQEKGRRVGIGKLVVR